MRKPSTIPPVPIIPSRRPLHVIAENITELLVLSTAIENGQFDNVVSVVPEIRKVAEMGDDITKLAAIEFTLKLLSDHVLTFEDVREFLAEVYNCSENMATLIVLHDYMGSLLNIEQQIPNFIKIASLETEIKGLYLESEKLRTIFMHLHCIHDLAANIHFIKDLHHNLDLLLSAKDIIDQMPAITAQLNGLVEKIEAAQVKLEEATQMATDVFDAFAQAAMYRGVWNPSSGVYPLGRGTNSYWDVLLDDGVTSATHDGKSFRNNDRLIFSVADNTYSHVAFPEVAGGGGSGGGAVTSVNGWIGDVVLDAADVNAVPVSQVHTSGGLINLDGMRNKIPRVSSDGVMEVGKYIDFHDTGAVADYSTRLTCNGNTLEASGPLRIGGYLTTNGTVDVGYNAVRMHEPESAPSTWAKSLEMCAPDSSALKAGIGFFGTPTTTTQVYMGVGVRPWETGFRVDANNVPRIGDYKVYHEGFKPNPEDVGAIPEAELQVLKDSISVNTAKIDTTAAQVGAELQGLKDSVTANAEAIAKLSSGAGGSLPVGSILMFAHEGDIPKGYINLCVDAPTFDIATYPELAKLYPDGKLPSYKNRYPRGTGSFTPGRETGWIIPEHNHTILLPIEGTTEEHTHTHTGSAGGAPETKATTSAHTHTHSGSAASAGAHSHSYTSCIGSGHTWGWYGSGQNQKSFNTGSSGAHTHSLTINSDTHTHDVTMPAHNHTLSLDNETHSHAFTAQVFGESRGVSNLLQVGNSVEVNATATVFAIKATGSDSSEEGGSEGGTPNGGIPFIDISNDVYGKTVNLNELVDTGIYFCKNAIITLSNYPNTYDPLNSDMLLIEVFSVLVSESADHKAITQRFSWRDIRQNIRVNATRSTDAFGSFIYDWEYEGRQKPVYMDHRNSSNKFNPDEITKTGTYCIQSRYLDRTKLPPQLLKEIVPENIGFDIESIFLDVSSYNNDFDNVMLDGESGTQVLDAVLFERGVAYTPTPKRYIRHFQSSSTTLEFTEWVDALGSGEEVAPLEPATPEALGGVKIGVGLFSTEDGTASLFSQAEADRDVHLGIIDPTVPATQQGITVLNGSGDQLANGFMGAIVKDGKTYFADLGSSNPYVTFPLAGAAWAALSSGTTFRLITRIPIGEHGISSAGAKSYFYFNFPDGTHFRIDNFNYEGKYRVEIDAASGGGGFTNASLTVADKTKYADFKLTKKGGTWELYFGIVTAGDLDTSVPSHTFNITAKSGSFGSEKGIGWCSGSSSGKGAGVEVVQMAIPVRQYGKPSEDFWGRSFLTDGDLLKAALASGSKHIVLKRGVTYRLNNGTVSSGTTIVGNRAIITGAKTGPILQLSNNMFSDNGVQIRDCIFEGDTASAVSKSFNQPHVAIEIKRSYRNEISSCTFRNFEGCAITVQGNSASSDNVYAQNNIIHHNHFENNFMCLSACDRSEFSHFNDNVMVSCRFGVMTNSGNWMVNNNIMTTVVCAFVSVNKSSPYGEYTSDNWGHGTFCGNKINHSNSGGYNRWDANKSFPISGNADFKPVGAIYTNGVLPPTITGLTAYYSSVSINATAMTTFSIVGAVFANCNISCDVAGKIKLIGCVNQSRTTLTNITAADCVPPLA